MGNKKCLLINISDRVITIKEWKNMFCDASKQREDYSTDEGMNLGPMEHTCYRPSKLGRQWKRRQEFGISSKIRVSFGGQNSNGVELLLDDFERNVGIVFNVCGNQLVKEPVSREQANMSEKTKISKKHEEDWKQRLIFIVESRNTASTSQTQQGEGGT